MKRILAIALFCCLLMSVVLGASASDGSGLIPFKSDNGKYGYKDAAGNEVIKASYYSVEPFYNGYAIVRVNKGGYAYDQYIDTLGNVVIPNINTKKYHYVYSEWQGDYGVVSIYKVTDFKCAGYNIILPNGHLLDSEIYPYVSGFSEGYALVGISSTNALPKNRMNMSAENGAVHWFSVSDSSGAYVNVADTYYFVDAEGNRLDNNTWSFARPFKGGFAPVAVKGADGSYLWGLIDNTGAMVVSPQWASISYFSDGLACVSNGEAYGYIDTTGTLVIPCTYQNAGSFSEGLAAVKVDDYYYGYIDTTGELVIPATYKSAGVFVNGTAIVSSGLGLGVIDTKGNSVIPTAYETLNRIGGSGLYEAKEYTSAMIYNENDELITLLLIDGELPSEAMLAKYPNGTECSLMQVSGDDAPIVLYSFLDNNKNAISMFVTKPEGTKFHIATGDGKTRILNAEGKPFGDGEWDGVKASASTEDRICVLKNNLYGFVDAEGNVVIQPQYTDATRFEGGSATVWIGQNAFVIDKNGKEALPPLQKGDKSDAVKKLQQALIDQGFLSGSADGAFGNMTAEAVMAAQAQFGMEQTGIADSDFQNMLFEQ